MMGKKISSGNEDKPLPLATENHPKNARSTNARHKKPERKDRKKWREEEDEKHISRLKEAYNSEDPLPREKSCRQEEKRSFTERMREKRKESEKLCRRNEVQASRNSKNN